MATSDLIQYLSGAAADVGTSAVASLRLSLAVLPLT